MKVRLAISFASLIFASPALAEVQVQPFSSNLFAGCVAGRDIGVLTDVSNPLLLLGSIVYPGKILTPAGIKDGLVRQSLPLPIVSTDAGSPDVSTCEHNFAVNTDANLSFLGFALTASKNDIYKVRVRLVARQKVAPVVQDGSTVQPWFSALWKLQFKQVIDSADPTVNDFFIFDNISIYLMDVEKYKKVGGGLLGAFGLVTAGGNYKRDESFKGTKLIVTGDTVYLTRSLFGAAPIIAASLPDQAQAIRTLSATEASSLQTTLRTSAADR